MTLPNFITLHALHAMPASLLNRDDTGAAKSITLGGTPRTRVSSQSWKRAMRTHLRSADLTDATYATRTRALPTMLAETLATPGPGRTERDRDAALAKASTVLHALVGVDDKGRTTNVLFVPESTVETLAHVIDTGWDDITDTATREVIDAAKVAFDETHAIDLALFGRMLATTPGTVLHKQGPRNVDAACSVAHAFSVDPARVMPDFFTAVDDYATDPGRTDQSMLGYSDLTAPVLYRHAALDTRTLRQHLAAATDADALTEATVAGFVDAFVQTTPTAKRASTAATTLPSFVLAVTGDRDLSLADAFTSAITSDDVLPAATTRLLAHTDRALRFLPDGTRAALLPITADPAEITTPATLTVLDGTTTDLTQWIKDA